MPSPLLERIPTKRIGFFALRIAVIWFAFVFAWPLFGGIYRPAYVTLGNAFFEGGKASATYSVADEIVRDHDIDIRLEKRGTQVWGEMYNSSRLTGYMPTITLLAFILATPIPWARRRKALLWGVVLIHLFVLVRMWVPIRRDFSNDDPLQVYEPGVAFDWLLGILERALVQAPASWFIVPIFIWVGVAFRQSDWELLQEEGGGSAAGNGGLGA